MYTGIIKSIGIIVDIEDSNNFKTITIQTNLDLSSCSIGDSICVNGVCLTITAIFNNQFTTDVMQETLTKTNLKYITIQQHVNLEPVLTLQQGIHGHLVQGHVDQTTRITEVIKHQKNTILTLQLDEELKKYLIPKGSICIDGTSLTVADIQTDTFSIALIPHTLQHTIAQYYQMNTIVNYEIDMLAKYMRSYMEKKHA